MKASTSEVGIRHSSEIHANSERINTQLPSNQHTNLQNSNPAIKQWLSNLPIFKSSEQLQHSQNRYSSSSYGMHQEIDLSNLDLSSHNSRPASHISIPESLAQANQASASKSEADRIKNALPWISAALGITGIIQLGSASSAANTLPPLTISGFICLIGSALACSYYIKK